jgi:dUTPase
MPLLNNNPTHVWVRTWEEVHAAKPNVDGIIHVRKGDRVAQLLIIPVAQASLVQVDSLDETERGEGSFGSTGVRL